MSDFTVGPGTQVTLHFSLSFENGEVIDSNFGSKPATFTFGDGKLLPGFEEKLVGLGVEAKEKFVISPEKAFGLKKEGNIKIVEAKAFSSELELEEGLVVNFADASGGEIPGVVSCIDRDKVTVDFNHPLAGRSIVFDVEILAIKPVVTH